LLNKFLKRIVLEKKDEKLKENTKHKEKKHKMRKKGLQMNKMGVC